MNGEKLYYIFTFKGYTVHIDVYLSLTILNTIILKHFINQTCLGLFTDSNILSKVINKHRFNFLKLIYAPLKRIQFPHEK